MTHPDPVLTSTRPRLVLIKGTVKLESSQRDTLKNVFELIEVSDADAARKLVEKTSGAVIVAPDVFLNLEEEMRTPTAGQVLERIGAGVGVVDANGTVAWTDARLKVHDDETRSQFIDKCREAINLFNRTVEGEPSTAAREQSQRFAFSTSDSHFELTVCPTSVDEKNEHVTSVAGVLWDVTVSKKLQDKLDAIDQAGADLLRIDTSSIRQMSLADRLKKLEEKIVRTVHDVLEFDNFEIRLLDKETGRLELVINENISPLKVGEVMSAKSEGHGISGRVATTGKSYICDDVRKDPLYREGLENAASALTVPLMLYDEVIGTMNVESLTRQVFDENDRRFAEIFGRYIAAALNILDLLVVQRCNTCEEITQNILSEVQKPLDELTNQVAKLRESQQQNEPMQNALNDLLGRLATVKKNVETCASGPKSVLGAEQELRRQQPDSRFTAKRVLIADDEPTIRETLHALLTQKGCNVTVCTSGVDAIAALKSAKEDGTIYDIIISDIKMPDRNGYEIYRTAKEIDLTTAVILMTGFGYDPHHCIVRASQEGLQSFLFKPFKASQLLEVMAKSLAEREALN